MKKQNIYIKISLAVLILIIFNLIINRFSFSNLWIIVAIIPVWILGFASGVINTHYNWDEIKWARRRILELDKNNHENKTN